MHDLRLHELGAIFRSATPGGVDRDERVHGYPSRAGVRRGKRLKGQHREKPYGN